MDCGGLWDEGSISHGTPVAPGGSHPASTTNGAEQLPHVLPRAQHGPESASPEALGTSKPILGQKSVN